MIANLSISFLGIVNSLFGGAVQGLTWGVLAIGVFLTYKILDVADLTVDGSLALGGCLAARLISLNVNPFLAMLAALAGGCLAGLCTGLMHTKLKIPAILSGILTMTALYSINYAVMDGSSIAILNDVTVNSYISSLGATVANLIISGVAVTLIIVCLYWFFGTEYGCAVRATGFNRTMAKAQGINTDNTIIFGLALSNGLAALCGSLIAQSDGSASVNMAQGTIVIGLASVVLGEFVLGKKRQHSFWVILLCVVVGSIIYRLIIMVAYLLNMPTTYTKLLSAVIIAIALALPHLKKLFARKGAKELNNA